MKLTSIISLYKEMKQSEQLRQQFEFSYNGVTADVIFLIDQSPFVLIFGIKSSGEYFEIKIKEGFRVPDFFDPDTFEKVLRIFKIRYDPNHVYRPADFWEAFSSKIPQHARLTKKVTPSSIIHYRRNVEEADKTYFVGFRDNNKLGCQVRNLDKTRKLMGEEAYARCKEENLSTRWTDEQGKDRFEIWRDLLQKHLSPN